MLYPRGLGMLIFSRGFDGTLVPFDAWEINLILRKIKLNPIQINWNLRGINLIVSGLKLILIMIPTFISILVNYVVILILILTLVLI